jgi:hypothetical protein
MTGMAALYQRYVKESCTSGPCTRGQRQSIHLQGSEKWKQIVSLQFLRGVCALPSGVNAADLPNICNGLSKLDVTDWVKMFLAEDAKLLVEMLLRLAVFNRIEPEHPHSGLAETQVCRHDTNDGVLYLKAGVLQTTVLCKEQNIEVSRKNIILEVTKPTYVQNVSRHDQTKLADKGASVIHPNADSNEIRLSSQSAEGTTESR